jgi:drug/metabolite transporter (DMT)-like permease
MTTPSTSQFALGAILVAGSAIVWSFGGTIARFLETENSWAIVFWRSYFAAVFLLLYMGLRDGPNGTAQLFRNMGWAGVGVASCFAIASTSFVVALAYTTVANILLVQAAVPLLAAGLAFALFGERASVATWIAISIVVAGLGVMVMDSLTGKVSPIGDGLALLIAVAFAIATVITRRAAHVRMMPATCLGTAIAAVFAFGLAARDGALGVAPRDMGLLVLFGAVNLGVGLALFSVGARLVPAAVAALIGTVEPVLAPAWVWLIHSEVPSRSTLTGGAIVFAALFGHLLREWIAGQRAKNQANSIN